MPKLILDRRQFLKGIASGDYQTDGIFRQSFTRGIDPFRSRATYGLLQQGYGQTNLTGSVVLDTIKWFVQKTDDYYGYGVDGYLYKFTGGSLTASELNSAGKASRLGARGLAIYNDGTADKLFYFSNTTIGTYDFASTYNNSVHSGLQNAPHPAKQFQGILYFGNGRYVGSVDATTLNLTALTLPIGFEVQDIEIYANYLAILAFKPTGTLNTECKLFLWDTFSSATAWSFEYDVPEKAYSLEKFKNDIAIFGYNVRLFNAGGFDIIHEIIGTTVYPGQTSYNKNFLYWQEYGDLMSYGSPSAYIPPSKQAPLTNTGEKGAIINLYSESTQFLISNNAELALLYNNNYSGGQAHTVKIELPVPSKVKGITLVFEKLVTNDGISFNLKDDQATLLSSKTITYAADGAITQKKFLTTSKISNYVFLELTWSSYSTGNLIIKKIIIDYDPTELTTA